MTLTDVKASGVFFAGECDLQLSGCTAVSPGPITAVFAGQSGSQVNVCRHCLEAQIANGDWTIQGAKVWRKAELRLFDRAGKPTVEIAIRQAPSLSRDLEGLAVRIRRNLLVHGAAGPTAFFMVWLIPDRLAIWGPESVGDPWHDPLLLLTWDQVLQAAPQQLLDVEDDGAALSLVLSWIEGVKARLERGDELPAWLLEDGLGQVLTEAETKQEPVAKRASA